MEDNEEIINNNEDIMKRIGENAKKALEIIKKENGEKSDE